MNIFYKLDDQMIWLHERVAFQVQLTFGVTPTNLAQLMYGCFIVSGIIHDIERHVGWVLMAFWPLAIVSYILTFPEQAKLREREAQLGFKNANKVDLHYRILRLIFLLFCTISTLRLATVFLAVSLYFSACDQLPPTMTRVRKVWNKLKSWNSVQVPVYGN